jgi:hypothetical protein
MNAIYYINLDRRPDRAAEMTAELARMGYVGKRVAAIDGRAWDGQGWKKQGRAKEAYWRGAAGCWLSHIKALHAAVAINVFPCLILEDDAVFVAQPVFPEGCDIARFGGLDRPHGTWGTHAIGYRTRAAAAEYLAFLKSHRNTADSVLNAYGKAALVRPWAVVQREGFSDIESQNMVRT